MLLRCNERQTAIARIAGFRCPAETDGRLSPPGWDRRNCGSGRRAPKSKPDSRQRHLQRFAGKSMAVGLDTVLSCPQKGPGARYVGNILRDSKQLEAPDFWLRPSLDPKVQDALTSHLGSFSWPNSGRTNTASVSAVHHIAHCGDGSSLIGWLWNMRRIRLRDHLFRNGTWAVQMQQMQVCHVLFNVEQLSS